MPVPGADWATHSRRSASGRAGRCAHRRMRRAAGLPFSPNICIFPLCLLLSFHHHPHRAVTPSETIAPGHCANKEKLQRTNKTPSATATHDHQRVRLIPLFSQSSELPVLPTLLGVLPDWPPTRGGVGITTTLRDLRRKGCGALPALGRQALVSYSCATARSPRLRWIRTPLRLPARRAPRCDALNMSGDTQGRRASQASRRVITCK